MARGRSEEDFIKRFPWYQCDLTISIRGALKHPWGARLRNIKFYHFTRVCPHRRRSVLPPLPSGSVFHLQSPNNLPIYLATTNSSLDPRNNVINWSCKYIYSLISAKNVFIGTTTRIQQVSEVTQWAFLQATKFY